MWPLIKRITILSKDDRYILGICLVVLMAASLGLYLNQTLGGGSGDGKQIGILRIKNNVAQRKYNEQVIWEDLGNNIPVFNNDSIRTGDLSAATIILNGGTEIELDENSMIVLNLSEDQMDINFISGSIQAKQTKSAEGSGETLALSIKSKDKTIKIEDSDIQLDKGDSEELSVVVKRGEASIQTADGQKQKIGKDERASLSSEGKIEIKKIVLRPTAPASGANLFPENGRQGIAFSWVATGNNEPVTLEVSNRRNFARPVVKRTVRNNSVGTTLNSGIYYWRISSRNPQTKNLEFSETRKLTITQNAPLRLHAPVNGKRFEYVNDAPLVNFSWSKNELASTYKIEVARDRNFGSVLSSREVQGTGTSLQLEAGNYFWRVLTQSSLAGATATSSVQSLRVVQREKVSPPTPLQPSGGKKIARVYFEKSGVSFNWKGAGELKKVELTIAKDSSFSQIVTRKSGRGNFATVKKSLVPGTYYWRLRGTDAAGTRTDYSSVASFTVGETENISLLSPGSGAEFDAATLKNDGLNLSWKKPQINGTFRIEIGRTRTLRPALRKETLQGLSYRVTNLDKGTYYWRVSMVDGSTIISTSDVRSFKVSNAFLPPVILAPVAGSTIDLTDRNDLQLRWKRIPAATYYQVTVIRNGKAFLNQRIRGTQWRITNLGAFRNGPYSWTVKACRALGNPPCSNTRKTAFNILQKKLKPPTIITSDEVFIIEE